MYSFDHTDKKAREPIEKNNGSTSLIFTLIGASFLLFMFGSLLTFGIALAITKGWNVIAKTNEMPTINFSTVLLFTYLLNTLKSLSFSISYLCIFIMNAIIMTVIFYNFSAINAYFG
jgi:hypothetical protein